MNILFLQDRPLIQGGAVLYMKALRRYLEGRGHRCRVLGFADEGKAVAWAGEDPHLIRRKQRRPLAAKFVRKLDLDRHLFSEIRRSVARLRPDVIHIHNYLGGGNAVLLACRGVPTVHTVHDLAIVCPLDGRCIDRRGEICPGPFGAACVRRGCFPPRVFLEHLLLRESVKRWSLKHLVDRLFVHSRFLAARLEACGLRPVRLPRYVEAEAFPFVPLDRDSKRVLFVGYLEESKGVEPLIRAFRRLLRRAPRARLDIVGEGPRKGAYLKMTEDLGRAVRFHGWVDHGETPPLYQAATVVAVPSQVPETGPFTALEAMCTGRPVMASRIGALPEVVREGETGHLVAPGDVEGMADRMAALLEDAERASAMGRAGRRLAERMSLDNPFPLIEEEYRALLKKGGGRKARNRLP